MPTSNLRPTTITERIQTIDIIRGFALFGILLINFTVDTPNSSPYEGWTGFGDQFVYWFVRLFFDDRFQTIYCFLFGLGFAIQMQKGVSNNSKVVFVFIRRMIVLFLIGYAMQIFTGSSFIVISYYAVVGILLLLFIKVPTKYLPALMLFFFVMPRVINTVARINQKEKSSVVAEKTVTVDTTVLDKYVGIYRHPIGTNVVLVRKGDSLVGESPTSHFSLTAQSDSQFLRKEYNTLYTFMKDPSGVLTKVSLTPLNYPDYSPVYMERIPGDPQKELQQQLLQKKADSAKGPVKWLSYREFVARNLFSMWYNFTINFPWQNFLWKGNYEMGYILVLFLMGMWAGRKRIFYDVAANVKLLLKIFKWGLITGGVMVAFNIGYEMWYSFKGLKYWDVQPLLRGEIIDLAWNVGIILMAMTYIAGFTLLSQNDIWKKRLNFFSIIGRMGLTNYILHLVANMFIFENVGWFLGLDGKASPTFRFTIAIAVFIVLYAFSRWWLTYFRMGPFEWLWKSAAYLKWQPMKKETVHSSQFLVPSS